ncbi:MAG: glutathione S-transferase family protein [Pseudomonadales bacterium]
MIDFYGMGSPNVLKVAIMLEELGLEYRSHRIGVLSGENYDPEFLRLNPIAKVPVIVDHDGAGPEQPLFESGAILIYLAETYESELLPSTGNERWEVLKWLMFQVSLVGPMLGQVNHFQLHPTEENTYAASRYRDQAARALSLIDDRLKASPFLGGSEYSIADIAVHPWMGYITRHELNESDYPHLIAWRNLLDERPAMKRAAATTKEMDAMVPANFAMPTDQELDNFFARRSPGPKVDMVHYMKKGPMFTAQADKDAKG